MPPPLPLNVLYTLGFPSDSQWTRQVFIRFFLCACRSWRLLRYTQPKKPHVFSVGARTCPYGGQLGMGSYKGSRTNEKVKIFPLGLRADGPAIIFYFVMNLAIHYLASLQSESQVNSCRESRQSRITKEHEPGTLGQQLDALHGCHNCLGNDTTHAY